MSTQSPPTYAPVLLSETRRTRHRRALRNRVRTASLPDLEARCLRVRPVDLLIPFAVMTTAEIARLQTTPGCGPRVQSDRSWLDDMHRAVRQIAPPMKALYKTVLMDVRRATLTMAEAAIRTDRMMGSRTSRYTIAGAVSHYNRCVIAFMRATRTYTATPRLTVAIAMSKEMLRIAAIAVINVRQAHADSVASFNTRVELLDALRA
jgi:hypothetical protein